MNAEARSDDTRVGARPDDAGRAPVTDTARALFAPPRAGISIPQFGNISISLLC